MNLKNYLENRKQLVNVNGMTSNCIQIDTGVPQGSILGLVLFLIYINDLPASLPNDVMVTLFADDTHVGIKGSYTRDNIDKIQNVILILRNWFEANCIVLNTNKNTAMNYTGKQKNESSTTFLGYEIDSKIGHKHQIF